MASLRGYLGDGRQLQVTNYSITGPRLYATKSISVSKSRQVDAHPMSRRGPLSPIQKSPRMMRWFKGVLGAGICDG